MRMTEGSVIGSPFRGKLGAFRTWMENISSVLGLHCLMRRLRSCGSDIMASMHQSDQH